MVGQCECCNQSIGVTQKRIKCVKCQLLYHSHCIKFSNEAANRSQWQCPKCVALRRREGGDNSNTPLREPIKPALPASATEGGSRPNTPTATGAQTALGAETDAILGSGFGDHQVLLDHINSMLDSKLQMMKTDIVRQLKASFADEIKKIASDLNQLEESHNNLLKEHQNLRNNHDDLCKKNQLHENHIGELRRQLGKQQQWARINNLEIVGLPETSGESPVELVIMIAKHAGVKLSAEEVESAHRVQPMQKVEGRPKPIVVKLRDRLMKDKIISGLRKTRGVRSGDIGLRGPSKSIFVNEHLTPDNKQLLKVTKIRAQEKSYKFVWVRNCNIFLRKNEESPVIAINTERDLQKIV